MEAQNQNQSNEDGGGKSSGGFLCRQSSTRWTPTSDQIRILKDLYYNNGVRSPSAEQIQRISARLRQYGKIEGKNVFYWFQNHKARERQKKRFTPTATTTATATATTDHIIPMQLNNVLNGGGGGWRSDQDPIYNKYPNITPGVPSPCSSSSPGMVAVGQVGSYGYGSVAMEKSFRDCSISPRDGSGGTIGHNFGWVGVDPYSSGAYPFLERRKSIDHETLDQGEEEEEEEAVEPEIETLPLFPMHGEDISGFKHDQSGGYYNNSGGWYDGMIGSRASLELSLNSYTGRSMGSR